MEGIYYRRYSILAYSILCVSIFFIWYFIRVSTVCSTHHIECVIDSFLAPSVHDYIQSYFVTHTFRDIQSSLVHIRSSFPWLEHIKMSVSPLRSVVRLYAHRPYACIGDRDAITAEGLLLEQKWYQLSTLEHCVKIEGRAFNKTASFAHFLHVIPREVHVFYNIEWIDHYTIVMHDRNAPLEIIATLDYPPSSTILESCLAIKNILASNHQLVKGWRIDTRFPGMLVLARRGKGYDASLS